MFDKDNYIVNQDATKGVCFGKYTSDYNGCGWIATYNLINYHFSVAEPYREVEDIIYFLEQHLWFHGMFGTRISQIMKYLRSCSLNPKLSKFKYTETDYGIVFYFTGSTFHYVFFYRNGKSEDQFVFFNVNNGTQITSFANFVKLNVKLGLYLVINM